MKLCQYKRKNITQVSGFETAIFTPSETSLIDSILICNNKSQEVIFSLFGDFLDTAPSRSYLFSSNTIEPFTTKELLTESTITLLKDDILYCGIAYSDLDVDFFISYRELTDA